MQRDHFSSASLLPWRCVPVPDPAPAHSELAPPAHPLALPAAGSLERHPVAVYLAHLAPGSRRVMRGALDAIARILTAGRCDALALDWAA
jgi:hypothetical protein